MREWFDNSAKGEALRSVAGALVAAGLMTMLGPFGTYDAMPAPQRALYWFTVIGLVWLQSDLVMRFLETAHAGRLPRPNLTLPVISAVLVALPATAVVVVATQIFMPQADLAPLALLGKVFLVLVIFGLAFNNLAGATGEAAAEGEALETERRMAEERLREAAIASPGENPDGAAQAPEMAFRARFPPGLSGRLLCLEMEDHYLRIHTDRGSDIILMRMSDAERELIEVPGMRVHRSWWVAREAVRELRRDGSRLELILENGMAVPVGKTYRSVLRDAGWLDDRS
jgi:hypothetical protein